MNTWGNDYAMSNQYSMQMNPMMANMMQFQSMYQPMQEMAVAGQVAVPQNLEPAALIGPVAPEDFKNQTINLDEEDSKKEDNMQQNKNHARGSNRNDNRRDRDGPRERSRRRSRSRERSDRSHGRDRNDRSRRDRRSKWEGSDQVGMSMSQGMPGLSNYGMVNTGMVQPGMVAQGMGNMPMTGMMTYGNMMGQQPMDMQNITNMQNVMPGMNMMTTMIPGMMDQSMMMTQQMPLPNQSLYISNAVLLPPIPGNPTPNRREMPPGCRTIFIGGLPASVKQENISEIFQRFGQIEHIKLHKQGVCHLRFEKHESVEQSFFMSGYRFRYNDQTDNEATTIFVDYALNRDDQAEFERNKRKREPTPPTVEIYSPATLTAITEKIKSDEQFVEAAPTLAVWLERGECNKKNANAFYSLIQTTNNQIRRLFNEKMQVDEEFQTMRSNLKDKFAHILLQFEQVAKILTAAKHQRVSDHFTKQQRRNIEMWLKMTEEVDNMKEEFNMYFDEDEMEKPATSKNAVPLEKYEQLKTENENLMFELEGYKNEAHLAKDEAERKFEKFKAHFIAQQALQNKQTVYPPLPPPPMPNMITPPLPTKPQPPPPTPDDDQYTPSGPAVPPSEAKLISILTGFLMVHPLGATLDYLVSYVKSMVPYVTHATVHGVLRKYNDVFRSTKSGMGATVEQKWTFVTYDIIKQEV